jgi:hypothetical protein
MGIGIVPEELKELEQTQFEQLFESLIVIVHEQVLPFR